MQLRQICDVQNHEIIIHLPNTFIDGRKVMVTVEDVVVSKADKLAQLKFAAADPLFQADLKSVSDDFQGIESELS